MKFKVVLVGMVLVGISFALQPTRDLQIDRQCQPNGWIASVREAISSSKFWALQGATLEKEVEWSKTFVPNALRHGKDNALIVSSVLEEAQQSMEKIFQKYPDLRPPEEFKLADKLRTQADKIEHDVMMQKMHEYNLKFVADYQKCISKIENIEK